MSEQARDRSTAPQTTPQEQTEQERLERALLEVREDALRQPGTYARDSVVPEGGE